MGTSASPSTKNACVPATGGSRFFPVHLATLRVDTIPDFSLYTRIGDRYVLYRAGDHPLTIRQKERLVEHGVRWLYVPTAELNRYMDYIQSHIPSILRDRDLSLEGKTRLFYSVSRKTVRTLMRQPGTAESLDRASRIVKGAVAMLAEGRDRLHAFMHMIGTGSDLFSHSIRVCTYGVALACELGLRRGKALRQLGLGLLLHDVGLTKVPQEILQKPDPLTETEWQIVRSHPRVGVEMFADSEKMAEESLRVIQTHHERVDGSGYPAGLKGEEIPIGGRVASIADVFDTLTTERAHRPARSTFEALKVMTTEMQGALDPNLLATFIRAVSR